jgi:hypothetical protein
MARRKNEEWQRQKFRKSDQCKIEWALVYRVHLPSDGNRRHRQCKRLHDLRREVESEVAVLQREA